MTCHRIWPEPQLPSRRRRRGQEASWCYTVGSAGKQSRDTASSRVTYYTLGPLHLPQPFKITSHHKIFMNRRRCSEGSLLQVAVTSVIAQYFPPQRKIVFIMCHEHRAKQSPLEWFPKGWREVVLNLNRRFWLKLKKKGEAGESSSLTLLLCATKSRSSCKPPLKIILNVSVTRKSFRGFSGS